MNRIKMLLVAVLIGTLTACGSNSQKSTDDETLVTKKQESPEISGQTIVNYHFALSQLATSKGMKIETDNDGTEYDIVDTPHVTYKEKTGIVSVVKTIDSVHYQRVSINGLYELKAVSGTLSKDAKTKLVNDINEKPILDTSVIIALLQEPFDRAKKAQKLKHRAN